MKINRSANTYIELPVDVRDKNGSKDAKATISMTLVVPSGFERKMQKFMAEQADVFSKAFKKVIKKEIEKHQSEE